MKTVIEKIDALGTAAQPLLDFMDLNCGPRDMIILDCNGVRLVEGVMFVPFEYKEGDKSGN